MENTKVNSTESHVRLVPECIAGHAEADIFFLSHDADKLEKAYKSMYEAELIRKDKLCVFGTAMQFIIIFCRKRKTAVIPTA